jgi:hypothetical protein
VVRQTYNLSLGKSKCVPTVRSMNTLVANKFVGGGRVY